MFGRSPNVPMLSKSQEPTPPDPVRKLTPNILPPSMLTPSITSRNLEEIKEILTKNPELLWQKMPTFTDAAERTFRNITTVQYVMWLMDFKMLEMILEVAAKNNLLSDVAAQQKEHFDTKNPPDYIEEHGRCFCIKSQMKAHATLLEKAIDLLIPMIRLLPAHLITHIAFDTDENSKVNWKSAVEQIYTNYEVALGQFKTLEEQFPQEEDDLIFHMEEMDAPLSLTNRL